MGWRSLKKWLLCFPALIALGAVVCLGGTARRSDAGIALFSWNADVMQEKERAALFDLMRQQGITTLYQYFSEDLPDEAVEPFLRAAYDFDIRVYLLTGEPEWGLDETAQSICAQIERAKHWREQWGQELLAGVMLDVEPYLTASWQESPYRTMGCYLRAMKAAHAAAQEAGLDLIACIPYFYDDDGLLLELEELIAEGCDGIAVMNYYRGREYEHLETELALAGKYGRTVVTVAELQQPGQYGLQEINTYAGQGYEAVLAMWKQLTNRPAAGGVSLGLHHYEALKELLDE